VLDGLLDFLREYGVYLIALVAAGVLIGFMLVNAIFSVWLERKVAGRIQDRLGPTRADGMKLLVKEDTIPAAADQFLFRLGPYIALLGSFLAFIALPFGYGVVAREMNIALFFMLAVMSSEVFGIILIGYGSGSKWSLFGGMREAAQMVSYEIPMALCVLIPVIVIGSMNLNQIAVKQSGGIHTWLVFHDPFTFAAFWTYFTCAMASCKRAPFDLAEAESELVAGFHTEYSGFRWLVIFMAEYGSMFAVSGIASIMFLGGWSLGFPTDFHLDLPTMFGFEKWGIAFPGEPTVLLAGENYANLGVIGVVLGNVLNVLVFIIKGWLLVFVMMWVRWTLPRLRIDQVMMLCLKYLIPISCVLLVGVSVWTLFIPAPVQQIISLVICVLSVLAAVAFVFKIVTLAKKSPGTGMPGMWRMTGLPGYQGAAKV
jgi:NADH-quinone oxidoreductase subunit H